MEQQVRKKGAGRPRAEDAGRKHEGMLEAALEEFASKGFHQASLRSIAASADVSTRTLYNRYPDKAALFAACLEQASAEMHFAIPQSLAPIEKRLEEYAFVMQRHLSQDRARQMAMLIFREGQTFAEIREIARIQFERYQVEPVAQLLREEGAKSDDAHRNASQFVAMAFGEWQRRLLFGDHPMTEGEMRDHAKLVAGIFLHGQGRTQSPES